MRKAFLLMLRRHSGTLSEEWWIAQHNIHPGSKIARKSVLYIDASNALSFYAIQQQVSSSTSRQRVLQFYHVKPWLSQGLPHSAPEAEQETDKTRSGAQVKNLRRVEFHSARGSISPRVECKHQRVCISPVPPHRLQLHRKIVMQNGEETCCVSIWQVLRTCTASAAFYPVTCQLTRNIFFRKIRSSVSSTAGRNSAENNVKSSADHASRSRRECLLQCCMFWCEVER